MRKLNLFKMLLVAVMLGVGSSAWAYDTPSGYGVSKVFIGTAGSADANGLITTVTAEDFEGMNSVPTEWSKNTINSINISSVTEVEKPDVDEVPTGIPTYVSGNTMRGYLRAGSGSIYYAQYSLSETVSSGKLVFSSDLFESGNTSDDLILRFLDSSNNPILTLRHNGKSDGLTYYSYAVGSESLTNVGAYTTWRYYVGMSIKDLVIDMTTGETSFKMDYIGRRKIGNTTNYYRTETTVNNINIGTGKNIAYLQIGKPSRSSTDLYFHMDNVELYKLDSYATMYTSAKSAYNTKVGNLDAAGQAYWNANTAPTITTAAQYKTAVDALPASYLAAVKAQTTPATDMSELLLTDVDKASWTGATGTYGGVAAERYNGNTPYSIGNVLYQTVSGLHAGYYQVKFYGVANVARTLGSEYYGSGIAQMYANSETQDVDVIYQDACTPISDTYLREFIVYLSEDNSNLEFGIKNIAAGGQWYVAQALSLTYLGSSSLDYDKAILNKEIEAATTVKNTWAPKVGTTPFKYASTYYDVLVSKLDNAIQTAASGSDDSDVYTAAKSELETAEGNMASSVMNLPAADKYYRLYLAEDGVSTGKNLNMLEYGAGKTIITTTPYPVKFVKSGDNYIIENPYDYYVTTSREGNNNWGAYINLTENPNEEIPAEDKPTSMYEGANLWTIEPQDDGTFKMLSGQETWKAWKWYLGTWSTAEDAIVSPYDGNASPKEAPINTWLCSEAVDITNVTLAVNATAGWGTFIAPYDNLKPSTVKAYTVSYTENNVVYFTENETGVLSANTPYILSTEEAENVSTTFKGIANNNENTYIVKGLVGLLTASNVPANSYVLQYNDSKVGFYKTTSSIVGTANRCYLDLESVPTTAASRTSISFNIYDGETTGVSASLMNNEEIIKNGEVYNLQGQRVSQPANGLYIVNGKIVIIK